MSTPLLEIRNATKVYGGGFLRSAPSTVALQGFNLTVENAPATITTIAGESGSGKSTLANLVLGFVNPSEGDVLYQGTDVAKMNAAQKMDFRREVQVVF